MIIFLWVWIGQEMKQRKSIAPALFCENGESFPH